MSQLRKILYKLYIELAYTRRRIDTFKADEERLEKLTPKEKTCEFYATGYYLEKGQTQGNIYQLQLQEKFILGLIDEILWYKI